MSFFSNRNPKNVVFFLIEESSKANLLGLLSFGGSNQAKCWFCQQKKKVYQPTTWNDSQYPDGFFWKNMQWPEILRMISSSRDGVMIVLFAKDTENQHHHLFGRVAT